MASKKTNKKEVEKVVLKELKEKEPEFTTESIEEIVDGYSKKETVKPTQKEEKEPEKVFVSDYRELVKVEGSKDTQRGRLYYGVKK